MAFRPRDFAGAFIRLGTVELLCNPLRKTQSGCHPPHSLEMRVTKLSSDFWSIISTMISEYRIT